ncbi:hypothetical protein V6U90_08040 [Micromonospora sp. CPCC 206060]|uniref:hypothetical protein n=1 Tax=Micromonospora sp. CPCC 206060 TaxID=3122406 RepID=UPI002FF17A0E
MPRKAAYETFETSNGLEFEFFLAAELGMTVARMRAEMPNDEFVRWGVYYQRKAQRAELEALKARRG